MLPASVAELKSAGTARLFQPARFGGCEADLSSGVDALAAVGRGCGSTAWCMVQHVTHNFMLSHWPDQGQRDIWGDDPTRFVSGIFIPACGRARSVEGGYVLSGRWPLMSGVNTSDWCLFAALVDGGGAETHRYFALPRDQVEIVDTWHAVGLKGSASNDVTVAEAFVPGASHAVDRAPQGRRLARQRDQHKSALSHAELLHLRGLYQRRPARHRRGRARALSRRRPQPGRAGVAPEGRRLPHAAGQGRGSLRCGRRCAAAPVAICDEAGGIAARDGLPSDEQRAKFRSHAAFAGRLASRAVGLLWDAGASSSVYSDNPMSRIYRDISVAGRHFTQNWDVNGSTHGRVLMGFELGDPTL